MKVYKNIKITFLLLILFYTGVYATQDYGTTLKTEVCIIGAGSAGIGAALSASRSGAKVVLIEKETMIGGTSTMSYVNSWEPGPGDSFAKEIYGRMSKVPGGMGVAKDIHRHMENNEPYLIWWIDDNLSYNSTLRRIGGGNRTPFDINVFDSIVQKMLNETGNCKLFLNTTFTKANINYGQIKSIEAVSSKGEKYIIEAKIFIDCTGNAAVCRNVGCETMLGEEPQSRFGEPSAPEEGTNSLNAISLCYQIKPSPDPDYENLGSPDDFDYNAAAWVTGPVGHEKKLTFNPYGIIQGDQLLRTDRDSLYELGKRIVDRQWAKLRTYPHFKNYVFDSYAPRLGIRESYRTVTDYVLNQNDLLQGIWEQGHDDIIALADHPQDVHGKGGILKELKEAYGIPYRCLIPIGWDNLLVAGNCAGFSHIAASSCRLSRTMMALGHAAGFAASIAAKNNISVKDVPVRRIQAEMNLKLRRKEDLFAEPLPINRIIGEIKYNFFITDNGKDSIFRVSKTGDIIWSYPAPNCQDIWSLKNGNILFTYHHGENGIGGVMEVTKDKEVVFHYQTKGEVHTCQRLENEDTMIGINKDATIIEVDKNGNIKKTISLKTERRGHDAIRMARKLENGHYLVAQEGDNIIAEYDETNKLINTFSSPGKCFEAIRLDNGNTLISDGSACSVRELDKKGNVVWQITKDDFPEIKMNWLAGINVLPNGNIILCNWLGHGKAGDGIPVFEISKGKEIVFYYTDNVRTNSISNVYPVFE
jgi:hypothetical protein